MSDPTPKTIRRRPVSREVRTAKQGSARDAIGELEPGCELYVLTFGQFSLVDVIVALLEQTGPAAVDIATWTAAHAHIDQAGELLGSNEITRLRFLIDRSFATRKPDYCRALIKRFGTGCIRTLRSHCKFVVIHNDRWHLAIRTSMNLNENPRLENLEISDDPGLCGFLVAIVDGVFGEHGEGDFAGEIPDLAELENVDIAGQVLGNEVEAGQILIPLRHVTPGRLAP